MVLRHAEPGGLAGGVWLEVWLAGTSWFEEDAHDRDDLIEPQPWEQAGNRLPSGL